MPSKRFKEIKTLLETLKHVRGDDIEGYAHYAYAKGKIDGVENSQLIRLMKKAGNFESYRRTRQKVQAENPHLKPDGGVQEMREKREHLMRETRGDVDQTDEILF